MCSPFPQATRPSPVFPGYVGFPSPGFPGFGFLLKAGCGLAPHPPHPLLCVSLRITSLAPKSFLRACRFLPASVSPDDQHAHGQVRWCRANGSAKSLCKEIARTEIDSVRAFWCLSGVRRRSAKYPYVHPKSADIRPHFPHLFIALEGVFVASPLLYQLNATFL